MKLYLETTMFNYYFDEDREGHSDTEMMSKTVNNPVEDEINAIRIELYEEMKGMTANVRVAYTHKLAEETLREHGYKFVPVDNTGAKRVVRA
jgi:hypothetical protein